MQAKDLYSSFRYHEFLASCIHIGVIITCIAFLQFVVDVQDFVNGGDVTVKIVQEREVVVEGRVDRLEGGVTSTKRFKKTFILSENIQVNSVTAVMSADGILTITAPKKVSD